MKYAEYFARGGFAVLAYDNINFGASGGEPRQEVDPLLQRRGYRDAITYAGLRPEIDKTRIGIFGTSFSGGHVLEVAAHDRRVKCVVSQIPAISGFKAFQRGARRDGQAAALKAQDEDREQRFLGKPPETFKVVSDDPAESCAMSGTAAYEYFMDQARIAELEELHDVAFAGFIPGRRELGIHSVDFAYSASDDRCSRRRTRIARPCSRRLCSGEGAKKAGTAPRQSFHAIHRRVLSHRQRSARLVHPASGDARIHRPQLGPPGALRRRQGQASASTKSTRADFSVWRRHASATSPSRT